MVMKRKKRMVIKNQEEKVKTENGMLLIMDRPAQSPDVIIIEAAWDLNRKQQKSANIQRRASTVL